MNNGQDAANHGSGGSKAYSVSIQVKAQSSTSCSFCWFITTLYPTLQGMAETDAATYTAHLRKDHGLTDDIQP